MSPLSEEYIKYNQLETIRMGMRQYLDDSFLAGMTIEQAERNLFEVGRGVGYEFRKSIWADKVADDTITETQPVTLEHEVATFESAWQLWKANHWHSKWFKYAVRWWAKEPQQTGRVPVKVTKTAQLEFRVCKYHIFPDFNPETYPGQFGNYYRYVQQDKLAFNWID